MDALGDGSRFGVEINYSIEEPGILGTAGALDNARDHLAAETFVVINGKIITDIDIAAALRSHKESGAIATMVLKRNPSLERFTVVEAHDDRVVGFRELSEGERTEGRVPLMFTGIQILEPRVFDWIPRGIYSDIVPTFYRPAIDAGERINAFVTDARWYEISTLRRYLDISLAMAGSGRIVEGAGCSVDASADVEDAVLWDNVRVERGAYLRRVVVGDGVNIAEGTRFENSVVVRGDLLARNPEKPKKAQPGYFEGENYIVPLG